MNNASERLNITKPGHIGAAKMGEDGYSVIDKPTVDENQSGNNVSLEDEMRTLGDSTRQMSMDTSIYKLFHRMILASVKTQ